MSDRIGPDLSVPAGLVGEMFITEPLVENQDGTGYTTRTPGGGVLILRFVPAGFAAARSAAAKAVRESAAPDAIARASNALKLWAIDEQFRSRNYWAERCGIDAKTLASMCDEKPDRARPAMRDEYEQASATRKARQSRTRRKTA